MKELRELTVLLKRDENGNDTVRFVQTNDDDGVIGYGFGDADEHMSQQDKQKVRQVLDALSDNVPLDAVVRAIPNAGKVTNAAGTQVLSDPEYRLLGVPLGRVGTAIAKRLPGSVIPGEVENE